MTLFATSSAPAVIDSLVKLFVSAVPVMRSYDFEDEDCPVYDGLPTNLPDLVATIGGEVEFTVDGTQQWAELGNSAMYEDYSIMCIISSYVGGAAQEANSPIDANTQKRSRDIAYAAYSRVHNRLLNDKQLINYGAPLAGSGWVTAARITATQTNAFDSEAGKGRRTDLTFWIQVKNRLGAIGGETTSYEEADFLTHADFGELRYERFGAEPPIPENLTYGTFETLPYGQFAVLAYANFSGSMESEFADLDYSGLSSETYLQFNQQIYGGN